MSLTVTAGYMAAHFYATWPILITGAVMSGFGASVYLTASGHYLNTVSSFIVLNVISWKSDICLFTYYDLSLRPLCQ